MLNSILKTTFISIISNSNAHVTLFSPYELRKEKKTQLVPKNNYIRVCLADYIMLH